MEAIGNGTGGESGEVFWVVRSGGVGKSCRLTRYLLQKSIDREQ